MNEIIMIALLVCAVWLMVLTLVTIENHNFIRLNMKFHYSLITDLLDDVEELKNKVGEDYVPGVGNQEKRETKINEKMMKLIDSTLSPD